MEFLMAVTFQDKILLMNSIQQQGSINKEDFVDHGN
jgi:hypothetical protein